MRKIDRKDRLIINCMQLNGSLSVSAIGEIVGLSQNACWRRIKRLEDEGILKDRTVIFDADKLGYPLTVYAFLRIREHGSEWFDRFVANIVKMPEVVEFLRMSGDIDYMAKIVARDVRHYDETYKTIISMGAVLDVSSSFLMEEIKSTTAIPLD